MTYSYVIFIKYGLYSAVLLVLSICSPLRRNSNTLDVI